MLRRAGIPSPWRPTRQPPPHQRSVRVEVPQRLLDSPPIEPLSQPRADRQRLLILFSRTPRLAFGGVHLAEDIERLGLGVGIGHGAAEGQRLLERRLRLPPAALLPGQHGLYP